MSSIENVFNHTKPCKMKLEFPTYNELDQNIKNCIDSLKEEYLGGYLSTYRGVEFILYLESELNIGFDSSGQATYYRTSLTLTNKDISQEEDQRQYIIETYGEDVWEKYVTSGNSKLTTKDTYVIIERDDYEVTPIKSTSKGETHKHETFTDYIKSLINKNKSVSENKNIISEEKKGEEQTRDSNAYDYDLVNRSFFFVPVTVKFYVDGVLNTDESLLPFNPFSMNINNADIMPTNNIMDLPNKLHIETLNDLSEYYIIIPYESSIIKKLLNLNAECVKDVYIENIKKVVIIDGYSREYSFNRLPKDLYTIDSNGLIRDAENPSNGFDFSKLEENYGIVIDNDCFDENIYEGSVIAILDASKLDVETVSGKMSILIEFNRSVETTDLVNISSVFYNTEWSINMDEDPTSLNNYFYSLGGNNGFDYYYNHTIQRSNFEARINGVLYSLLNDGSDRFIVGLKKSGMPWSRYYALNGGNCGCYDYNKDIVEDIEQDVTAYIMNKSVFENLFVEEDYEQ